MNYKPKRGLAYRLSLDRELGRHIDSKTAAEKEAAKIRVAIDEGTFRAPSSPAPVKPDAVTTFEAFAQIWTERRGKDLVSAPIDAYRLKTINGFVLPGTQPPLAFGAKRLDSITTDDIEGFRDSRKAKGLSAVSVNHDLRLLRKMFNWAIRKGHIERSPFKLGSEPAIQLEREIPRNKRFPTPEVEQKLLDAANPHLRGVVTAMLDTACRPGEILSLQWRDVSLERRELTIRAEKEKTRRERIIPISARLLAILKMRQQDAAGQTFGSDVYVFGDSIGRQIKSVWEAWKSARTKAGRTDFQHTTETPQLAGVRETRGENPSKVLLS
jgi:integrase